MMSKYICHNCGEQSLEVKYHFIHYLSQPNEVLCDACYFDQHRQPLHDFNDIKSISTINNEPEQLDLWGNPLFLPK